MPARTGGRLRRWLSVRHSLRAEAALVLALYGLYELARSLVVGDAREAVDHARELVALERSTGMFVEERVQDAAHTLPGLIDLLNGSYLTLHLAVTVAVLLWLHRRRPDAFPLVRTTLVVASGLALVGYLLYPTAPPRLAGIGIADTVSGGHIDLNSGLVSSLYNPYAAVPSMHVGYALVVGASVVRYGRRPALRFLLGVPYPLFVLFVVVATGNHFLVDALAGASVTVLATSFALLFSRPTGEGRVTRLAERRAPAQAPEELAA
jgi:hypothetical protein